MKHKLWVLIENNEIKKGPCELPKSWGNISGLYHWGEKSEGVAKLRLLGWWPWDNTQPLFDTKAETVTWNGKDFENDNIKGIAKPTWTVTARDVEKEEAEQEAALRAELGTLLEERAEAVGMGERQQALLAWDGKTPIPKELS